MNRLLMFVAVASCTALGLAACGDSAGSSGDEWGPLAVVDSPGTSGGEAGTGPGTVEIGEQYVTITTATSEQTLAWPSGTTEWDGADKSITYRPPGAPMRRLTAGARIELGGSPAEDGSRTKWIKPPDEDCPDTVWFVGEVTPVK